jgi:hypothetical protein
MPTEQHTAGWFTHGTCDSDYDSGSGRKPNDND